MLSFLAKSGRLTNVQTSYPYSPWIRHFVQYNSWLKIEVTTQQKSVFPRFLYVVHIGPLSNSTWFVFPPPAGLQQYHTIGCFIDRLYVPAIPTMEGKDPILDGSYWDRKDPVRKCFIASVKRGYKVFAVQNNRCYSGPEAHKTYAMHGKSRFCPANGAGKDGSSQVYRING